MFRSSNLARLPIAALLLPIAIAAQSAPAHGRATPPARVVIDSSQLKKKPVPRPEFQMVRYAESWLARPVHADGWDDPLKHIDIARGDVVHLTLNGNYRWRGESHRNYMMSDAANAQDEFVASRLLVGADFRIGQVGRPYLRAYAEYRDAQGFNRTLPGGLTTSQLDRTDFQNYFLEAGTRRFTVRGGRQEVIFGKERFVGVSDWGNGRRAFYGVRALATLGPAVLDVLDAQVMQVRSRAWNIPDSTSTFHAIALSSRQEAAPSRTLRPASWHTYVLQYKAVVGARHERTMYGARLGWRAPLKLGNALLALDAESGTQRGYVGTKPLVAWFNAAEATVTFKGLTGAPMLQLAYDRGTGTKGGTDPHAGTLSTLYGSAHSYDGIADALGIGNLGILRVGAGADPTRWLQLRAAWRSFRRVELGDGVYSKANVLFRAASGSPYRDVGVETDLVATIKATRNLRLQAGVAELDPGKFLTTTPGGAHAFRFSYVSSVFTF